MDSVDNIVFNVDNRPSVEQGSNGQKRRLNINPAKAVIGGITQSTHAVRGGLSQSKQREVIPLDVLHVYPYAILTQTLLILIYFE